MNTRYLIPLLLLLIGVAGCEDTPPTTYVPQYVLQGYLIVDDPVQGIRITLTQPTTEIYQYRKSAIEDAEVDLIAGDRRMRLVYYPDSLVGEYRYPDTTVRIEPNTTYNIEVRLADGALVTAATTTPGRVSWTKAPRDTIQYPPSDTVRPPDSLSLAWTPVPGNEEYMISIRSLDTLRYGRYLTPPTSERNTRIVRPFEENAPDYKDVTRWAFLQGTRTPLVWAAFKWYGMQEVTVYAADKNFLDWFKMTQWGQNVQYDSRLGSVKGGVGVFGSASVARKTLFVLKKKV
jgi:hypothetical protein